MSGALFSKINEFICNLPLEIIQFEQMIYFEIPWYFWIMFCVSCWVFYCTMRIAQQIYCIMNLVQVWTDDLLV